MAMWHDIQAEGHTSHMVLNVGRLHYICRLQIKYRPWYFISIQVKPIGYVTVVAITNIALVPFLLTHLLFGANSHQAII